MNLSQFSASLITTPAEAKSLMNIIIGMSPSGPDVLNGLIALYESLPENVKCDDAAFAPTFHHLLQKYQMQASHLPYYEKFSGLWSPAALAGFKKQYSAILVGDGVQSFKNSLEFAKATQSMQNKYGASDAFAFVESHFDGIVPMIKKDSKKFMENMRKYHCWGRFIEHDYDRFKKLCHDLNLDTMHILKQEYATIACFYGVNHIVNRACDASLENIFQDISNIPDFFADCSFLLSHDKKVVKHHYNVLETCIKLLASGKHDTFCHLFNTYAEQIQQCMQPHLPRNSVFSIYDTSTWNMVFDSMEERTQRYHNDEALQKGEMHMIAGKIKGNFKIIDVLMLERQLPVKDDIKSSKLKI